MDHLQLFTCAKTYRNASSAATVPIIGTKSTFRFSYLSVIWPCNTSRRLVESFSSRRHNFLSRGSPRDVAFKQSSTGHLRRQGGGRESQAFLPGDLKNSLLEYARERVS
jgi:hypothetical protein